MRERSRTVAQKVVTVASEQHGVITREQLLGTGMSSSAIGRWTDKGLLIREYAGVYRVGHAAPSTEATYMAAVLVAGDDALLAGRAAAHLMRLLRGAPPPPEVIAPTEKRIKELRVKRGRAGDGRDATTCTGIPTTTVARTLVDLAACLSEYELGHAVHQASVLYRTQPEDVEAVLERRPTSKGAGALRAILHGDAKISLSRLERAFVKLLEANDLELPQTNKQVGGRYVDCRWPGRKLTVELDSYRYHSTRHAWELDRKRERQARARGDDFRRYTSDDVFEDPRALLRELRPVIGH
jgi:predicted transcriptional regulator of viral defense system